MARAPSFKNALRTSNHRASAVADATLTTAIFRLDDAKESLLIEDTESDHQLALLVQDGLALLSKTCGRSFHDTNWVAEYSNSCDWQVGLIDRTDCTAITAIVGYDADGTDTAIATGDYDVAWVDSRVNFRRTDGEYFVGGDGVSAAVSYSRGIPTQSNDAMLLRAAMRHYCVTAYNSPGSLIESGLRRNPEWTRVLQALMVSRDLSQYAV